LKKIDFVRELPVADYDAELQAADAPLNDRQIDLPASVGILEKRMIRDAMVRSQWHRGKAAALLNIDRKTLYVKLKKYNIAPA
jgi:transcriptional regulator of acetoin/glycerol metabolism